ncbi:beta-ketoacyl synthase N-terminal-like domain-containing protein [Streptacidiphilus neutrinimicus]|uniref:beta-ketoacyl synthase N-terminal-like domain-containing protein n=1 Tax=Streptacidiphilus neutrinimicus TaxID=105420 RepID=UPI000693D93B|nr:beta-ketoacyl synthase N-terminal-like domain-containing protein [Streptacidiphilus neutrinimicus]
MSTPRLLDAGIVVTGVGPVSRHAIGRAELAGVATEWSDSPARDEWLRPLDAFDAARRLGRKGWRALPPAARYAMVAARLAGEDARLDADLDGNLVGVVLGTNFAADETVDRFDRAVLAEGVRGISPLEAPNFSINVAASQVSVDRGYRAFNITLIDLFTAGSSALWTACQALEDGRAPVALAGAAEGRPPRQSTEVLAPTLDEGAACLLCLETTDHAAARAARPLGQVRAGAQLFVPAAVVEAPDRLDALTHSLLDGAVRALPAGLSGVDVDVVRPPASARAEAVAAAAIRWTAARTDAALVGGPDGGRAAAQASATAPLRLASQLARRTTASRALVQVVIGPEGHLVVLVLSPTA